MIRYERVERHHIPGMVSLCQAEGIESYTESEELTWQALTAPGVTTFVALEDDDVLGFVQLQSDGHIQAHLSLVLVTSTRRRKGIGRNLVTEAFTHAGGKRVDLVTDSADEFYRSFKHKDHWRGYRIYPGDE